MVDFIDTDKAISVCILIGVILFLAIMYFIKYKLKNSILKGVSKYEKEKYGETDIYI